VTAAEDQQTRRAVASLVRRLRERDEAVRAGAEDVADWEPFAAEYIAALRGQGWRWLPNLAPAVIHAGDGGPPAGYLTAKAAIEAHAVQAAADRARAEGRIPISNDNQEDGSEWT
jgi:hypothetical protein